MKPIMKNRQTFSLALTKGVGGTFYMLLAAPVDGSSNFGPKEADLACHHGEVAGSSPERRARDWTHIRAS